MPPSAPGSLVFAPPLVPLRQGNRFFPQHHGYFVAARILRLDQVSPALELKMGYVFSTLPFCYVLTSIRLIQNLHASIGELLGKGKENAA